MQVILDRYDRMTVYADLREEESLTDALRVRAIDRARQLGAEHVEFWRPPYGSGADCMQGFIEFARVSSAAEPDRQAGAPLAHSEVLSVTAPTSVSVEQV